MRTTCFAATAALALVARLAGAQADVMFVTSASGPGNLGSWAQADGLHGLAAGNRICQNLAAVAHLANAATFQAWLSDTDTDAFCNLKARGGHPPTCGAFTVNNPGPWARTDGQPFARTVGALAANEIFTPPVCDENGDELPFDTQTERVWTGTHAAGTATGSDCADVTGQAWNDAGVDNRGTSGFVSGGPLGEWTEGANESCSANRHLYCFQHSLFGGPPFDPFEGNGALVFLTSTSYSANLGAFAEAGGQTGRNAGDAICVARAAAGALPHPPSFHAWLSSNDVDARDVSAYDGPFKRLDGVAVASSKADLLDDELATPIAETERLTYPYADQIWTGTVNDGGASAARCFDWTDDDFSTSGGAGVLAISSWSIAGTRPCSSSQPLYCFSDTPVLFWTGFEESGGGLWRWAARASE